jgi:disulfide bond formation protein DsbB
MKSLRAFLDNQQGLLAVAWGQALLALAGSLFFSNIALFVPCDLCWWQRIFMYPQVILLGIGLWRREQGIAAYSLPLVGIGWFIAFYHTILYYNVNYFGRSNLYMPCSLSGTSCTTRYIEYFGFVTIPLLALTAFTIIGACLIRILVLQKKQRS